MKIPDYIKNSVAFLMYRDKSEELKIAGTAFLVFQDEEKFSSPAFFVTAKHVIDGIRSKSVDETVYMRANDRHGRMAKTSFHISEWFGSQYQQTDVAALYWPKSRDIDLKLNMTPLSISATTKVIEEKSIGIGDETFVIGLFSAHTGREFNEPIARIGNIACFPKESVPTKIGDVNAYLIESRSSGGLSGSPVYVHLQTKIREDGISQICFPYFLLLGIMHGHFDINPQIDSDETQIVNSGVGIVIPVDDILEVINGYGDKFKMLAVQEAKDMFMIFARAKGSKPSGASDEDWRQYANHVEGLDLHSFIEFSRKNLDAYSKKTEPSKEAHRQKAKDILREVLGIQ